MSGLLRLSREVVLPASPGHRLVDHRNERHCRDCGRFAEYCEGTTCPEPGSGRFDCTDPEIWWRMELDLLAARELPEDRWPEPQRRVREMAL